MTPSLPYDGGSFKDPSGRVFHHDGRVFRALTATGRAQFQQLVDSGLYDALHGADRLVATSVVDAAAIGLPDDRGADCILEHEAIPFITYPYEWGFAQMRDAALLTLDVMEDALHHNFILKDATPFNVQFLDGAPIFIDVLSLESYEEGSPWRGYAQFCSCFLYPLMLTAYRDIPFQPWVRGAPGGIPSTEMSRLFGWRDLLRPGIPLHVKLPARLQRSFADSDEEIDARVQAIQFTPEQILTNVDALRRIIGKMRVAAADSAWADYATSHSYSDADHAEKQDFVQGALERIRPASVWDLGCNIGEYSQLAAESGARVVAIDGDPAAIDRLYLAQRAGEKSGRIQPLVGDFGNPSPDLGWALAERRSWWARGQADAFLALALVHHLAISANVPLPEIVTFLVRVAPAGVAEFVTKDDPMVRRLLQTRQDVFPDYTLDHFRNLLAERFKIVRETKAGNGTRVLFELTQGS